MIRSQSRLHTVFGGAAGYIAIAFVLLLVVFHIQQNYDLIPQRSFSNIPDAVSPASPEVPGPLTEIPAKILPSFPTIKPTDMFPAPFEYAEDQVVLKQRHLAFPLKAIPRDSMKDTFRDVRGGGRLHEGVDILAPRNTPIVAIEDGRIARLWTSKYGGLTIYQFDPTNSYVYYYAHLEKYAAGIKEGQIVQKGQVIGYVGTSGNAPPNTPHLHFAIYKAQQPGRWWQGKPIDPYAVFS